MFKGVGSGAINRLKEWWRGGPDIAKVFESKPIAEIPDNIYKMKVIRNEMMRTTDDSINNALRTVHSEIKTLSSRVYDERKRLGVERGRLNQFKMREEGLRNQAARVIEPERREAIEVEISNMHEQIANQEASIRNMEKILEESTNKHITLSNLNTLITREPKKVVEAIESNPDFGVVFPSLERWYRAIEGQVSLKNKIANAISRNIDNDRRFFKEYLKEIYPNVNSDYAKMWLTNPQNALKLSQIRLNKRYLPQLLDLEHGTAFREKLENLSKDQLLRKLKISGVVGAGLTGVVGFLTWFDDNDEIIVSESDKAENSLLAFKPNNEEAKAISQQALTAAQDVMQITMKAEHELGNNPEQVAPAFANELIKNKQLIDQSLAKWDKVVKGSSNPEEARKTGKVLEQYSTLLAQKIDQLGQASEINIPKQTGGIAGDIRTPGPEGTELDHVKSVQRYLKDRFPTVAETGILDEPTIRALRTLEREYDRLGNTGGRISQKQLLVRPKEGHLININDLKRLDEMMRKYE